MDNLTFELTDFEGPLDLLLHLISKNKMQIADIPIVSLIDQYLELVNSSANTGLDKTSEFIEMAAKLVYMKSVFLLPRSEEQELLRQELTGMLIEYSVCKRIASELGVMAEGVYLRVRKPLELEFDMNYQQNHNIKVLHDAYVALQGKCVRRVEPQQEQFDAIVTAPFVSVAGRVIYVLRGVITGKVKYFRNLFDKNSEKSESVATFLAVLELVKSGRISMDDNEKLTLKKHGGKGA